MTLYKQCRLQCRLDEERTAEEVAWIPEEFAVVGAVLRIDRLRPPDGWVVVGAAGEARDARWIGRMRWQAARDFRRAGSGRGTAGEIDWFTVDIVEEPDTER